MLDHAFEDPDEMRDREQADRHLEQAHGFLHATGAVRYCPACATDVLVSRRGECLWCDGQTTSFTEGTGAAASSLAPSASTTDGTGHTGQPGASVNTTSVSPAAPGRASQTATAGGTADHERQAA